MKTLMYPIAPEDDFPDMFCAIRQGSGEHWFYVPEGESASEMLLHMEVENAQLREELEDALRYINRPADGSWTRLRCKEVRDSLNKRMRELGVDE